MENEVENYKTHDVHPMDRSAYEVAAVGREVRLGRSHDKNENKHESGIDGSKMRGKWLFKFRLLSFSIYGTGCVSRCSHCRARRDFISDQQSGA